MNFLYRILSNVFNSHATGHYFCTPPCPTPYGWNFVVTSSRFKTEVDLQILQTKYGVIQIAMNRSRRVSVAFTWWQFCQCNAVQFLKDLCVLESFAWLRQSWKSGRAFRVGPVSGLSLSKCFGPISGLRTIFLQWRTLLSPVTVKAIDFIKFWIWND